MDQKTRSDLLSGQAALYRDGYRGTWYIFRERIDLIYVYNPEQILCEIELAQQRAARESLFLFMLISYEASSAFENALVLEDKELLPKEPLLIIALYRHRDEIDSKELEIDETCSISFNEEEDHNRYVLAFDKVKAHIKRGDVYQVNLTQQRHGKLSGDPLSLFLSRIPNNSEHYYAFIALPERFICSLSPELFFDISNGEITCKPMKGTAARGRYLEEDIEIAEKELNNQKSHAENVMIVDLIRNDLTKIAIPGTVKVTRLFELQKLPTVWQMTSTIQCWSESSLTEILTSLFPCGSITGAPKIKAVELSSKIEAERRGIYTGAIGWTATNHSAQFNIAIRTALIDRKTSELIYGVGSGIVFDSISELEYEECKSKTLGLSTPSQSFEILETMLWSPETEIYLLQRHLDRAYKSAQFFGFPLDITELKTKALKATEALPAVPHKVRALIDHRGAIHITTSELNEDSKQPLTIKFAKTPVDTDSPFIFNKTSNRKIYTEAWRGIENCDDVILWNSRGEITEATIYSIMALIGDRWITPPISSGLLPGTLRAELIDQGKLNEEIITIDQLKNARQIKLFNSVRGVKDASLVS